MPAHSCAPRHDDASGGIVRRERASRLDRWYLRSGNLIRLFQIGSSRGTPWQKRLLAALQAERQEREVFRRPRLDPNVVLLIPRLRVCMGTGCLLCGEGTKLALPAWAPCAKEASSAFTSLSPARPSLFPPTPALQESMLPLPRPVPSVRTPPLSQHLPFSLSPCKF